MLQQAAWKSVVPSPGDTAGGTAAPRPASAAPACTSQVGAQPPACQPGTIAAITPQRAVALWAYVRALAAPLCPQAPCSAWVDMPSFSSWPSAPLWRSNNSCIWPGNTSSRALLQPLAGAVGQLWSQHQRPSATCSTWSGFHFHTFDGRHYHFLGHCTYLLAGMTDSSWAVHLRPGGHCRQPGPCQLVRWATPGRGRTGEVSL